MFYFAEDSRNLVELFRKQVLRNSNLLPILVQERELQGPLRRKTIKCVRRQWESKMNEAPPPPPRFESSMHIRGRMLAHRAGYSEPFLLWCGSSSSTSRFARYFFEIQFLHEQF